MINCAPHSSRCPNFNVSPTDRLTRCFLEARDDLLRFLTRRAGRAAAEDALQDVWLHLRERSDPTTWREPRAVLFTTAANLATDFRRRDVRASRIFVREETQPDAASTQADPEAQAGATASLERLDAALRQLPQVCREAFLLNRLDALTHAEIAERLGVSTKSVQRYIERALRHCLEALDHESG